MKFLREYTISTHAPAGGATGSRDAAHAAAADFYSRPCGRGDCTASTQAFAPCRFLLTPLREGRHTDHVGTAIAADFYSRPCGRGDLGDMRFDQNDVISTHAPAGGATLQSSCWIRFSADFYSRPCGRGDKTAEVCFISAKQFLLTPLREGRRRACVIIFVPVAFLLTPLREGRRKPERRSQPEICYFYSRPCGRGDVSLQTSGMSAGIFLLTPLREGRPENRKRENTMDTKFLLTPLREGRPNQRAFCLRFFVISTHAPAGGATPYLRDKYERLWNFYSRPCGRGDCREHRRGIRPTYFYSRPCGRGD